MVCNGVDRSIAAWPFVAASAPSAIMDVPKARRVVMLSVMESPSPMVIAHGCADCSAEKWAGGDQGMAPPALILKRVAYFRINS